MISVASIQVSAPIADTNDFDDYLRDCDLWVAASFVIRGDSGVLILELPILMSGYNDGDLLEVEQQSLEYIRAFVPDTSELNAHVVAFDVVYIQPFNFE